jgi:hypothetical protein
MTKTKALNRRQPKIRNLTSSSFCDARCGSAKRAQIAGLPSNTRYARLHLFRSREFNRKVRKDREVKAAHAVQREPFALFVLFVLFAVQKSTAAPRRDR